MVALLVIILLGGISALALLWIAGGRKPVRISFAIIIILCLAASLRWVVRFDRPILIPDIGEVITQSNDQNAFALDVEALVKNSGRQAGYADKWKLTLNIDESSITGKQLYGQLPPAGAVSEPQLFDEEFPSGKPVRGWLYFAFPGVAYDFAMKSFTCGSPLMDKVGLSLSVWDSKTLRERTQTRSLSDLSKERCKNTVPIVTPAQPHEAHTSGLIQRRQLTQPKRAALSPANTPPSQAKQLVPPSPVSSSPRPAATFEHLTAVGAGTAILDCDPLATFNDVVAATTSPIQPAVAVGSSQCHNQESFKEYSAYEEFKSAIARDAGSTASVKADLEELKAKLHELRKPEYEAEHQPEGYWEKLDQEFSQMETAFLTVAEDKEKTLEMLSHLKVSHR